jgi:hypothetical protein
MDTTTGGMRGFAHGALAMLVVVLLAGSWPAVASTGMAWASPSVAGWLDAVLVFAPLVWAPLPAVLVWLAIERAESGTQEAGLRVR